MANIDLNSDLGESFGPWVMGADEAMLDIVSSANIACGGHAGDEDTMFKTLSLAVEKGVCVGAHPGFNDKAGFGRRLIPLTANDVTRLVAAQVGTLKGMAGLVGAAVRYIKPHGALGNWAAVNGDVASAIADAVKRSAPECAILAISGTELETASRQAGLQTYSEIFADRGYQASGNLQPRSEPGALIENPEEACNRLIQFFESGKMPTVDGGEVELQAHSICIHGDNPHAVDMGRQIKKGLIDHGFELKPFVV